MDNKDLELKNKNLIETIKNALEQMEKLKSEIKETLSQLGITEEDLNSVSLSNKEKIMSEEDAFQTLLRTFNKLTGKYRFYGLYPEDMQVVLLTIAQPFIDKKLMKTSTVKDVNFFVKLRDFTEETFLLFEDIDYEKIKSMSDALLQIENMEKPLTYLDFKKITKRIIDLKNSKYKIVLLDDSSFEYKLPKNYDDIESVKKSIMLTLKTQMKLNVNFEDVDTQAFIEDLLYGSIADVGEESEDFVYQLWQYLKTCKRVNKKSLLEDFPTNLVYVDKNLVAIPTPLFKNVFASMGVFNGKYSEVLSKLDIEYIKSAIHGLRLCVIRKDALENLFESYGINFKFDNLEEYKEEPPTFNLG